MGGVKWVSILGLFLASLSFAGLVYLGTGDSKLDAHLIFFIDKPEKCVLDNFIIGGGTFFNRPTGKSREISEISFKTNCTALVITSTHRFKPVRKTGIDLGLSSGCDKSRRLIKETKDSMLATARYTYKIETVNPSKFCKHHFIIPKTLKKLTFSSYLLLLNIGPNADEISLWNAPGWYGTIISKSKLTYYDTYVHRYRVIIKSSALEYWERVLTIVFAALLGVGVAVFFEGIILRLIKK